MNAISHLSRVLAAGLLALALLPPRPALAGGTTPACGPIEGKYFRKNYFTVDDGFVVTRQGKAYRFSLGLLHATQFNDGSLTSNGTTSGHFVVKSCRAHFDDRENQCRFEFTFKDKNTVDIVQIGSCIYFGHGIDATGTFKKR